MNKTKYTSSQVDRPDHNDILGQEIEVLNYT